MATHVSAMSLPHFSNSTVTESDMDAWLDFSVMNSPIPNGPSMLPKQQQPVAASAMTSPTNTMIPLDNQDDLQTPAKPSHEYGRFKQQTGLPSNSVPGIQSGSYSNVFSNSGTGLDEMSLMDGSGLDSWSQDFIGMDTDMSMASSAMPSYFYSQDSNLSPNTDDFVDPSDMNSQDQISQNQRYFPGVHQQRAAMAAKVQAQAQQQRRHQMMQKTKQPATEPHNSQLRRSPSDAHAEETIARVVNQIRQSSQLASRDPQGSNSGLLPHIIRAKKDEEDMDEDERLLASEEGKKLSSKERRQLRNKVSARAFRSRRKEYIGQLEGEVAAKTDEANELKVQNRALMEENARSRALIEKLLRHPAFTPFLDDISKEEALKPRATEAPLVPQTSKDTSSFGSGQIPFTEAPAEESFHVGMTMIPETPLDISALNINNNNSNWNVPFNYSNPRVFAVTEIPEGPSNPVDVAALSGKSYEPLLPQIAPVEEEVKRDYPVIERRPEPESNVTGSNTEEQEELNSNPAFALYSNITIPSETSNQTPLNLEFLKKPHFELVVVSEEDSQRNLDRLCAMADASYNRIGQLTPQE